MNILLNHTLIHLLGKTASLPWAYEFCPAFFGFLDSDHRPCAFWTTLRNRFIPHGVFTIGVTRTRKEDTAATRRSFYHTGRVLLSVRRRNRDKNGLLPILHRAMLHLALLA